MSHILIMFGAKNAPIIERSFIVDLAANKVMHSGPGLLEEMNKKIDQVVLVLPGMLVATKTLNFPKKITSQVRAAMPTLLEDHLALPGQTVHFAIGPTVGQSRIVAVVDKEYLSIIYALLEASKYSPDLIVADYMLLGASAEEAVVVEHDGTVLVGLASCDGCSLEQDLVPTVLPGVIKPDIRKVTWYGANAKTYFGAMVDSLGFEFENMAAPDDDALVLRMAQTAFTYSGINLQDGWLKKSRPWSLPWPKWRRTISFAAIAGLFASILVFSQAWQMNERAETIDKLSGEHMRTVFPGALTINHLRAKIREMEPRENDQFLSLSNLVFGALRKTGPVSIAQLDYERQTNRMVIKIVARDRATIGSFKDALSKTVGIAVSESNTLEEGLISQVEITVEAIS